MLGVMLCSFVVFVLCYVALFCCVVCDACLIWDLGVRFCVVVCIVVLCSGCDGLFRFI